MNRFCILGGVVGDSLATHSPLTTSRKKAASDASSSAVLPAHFFASADTAASSRYTPMAVNLMKLPPISRPRTPARARDKPRRVNRKLPCHTPHHQPETNWHGNGKEPQRNATYLRRRGSASRRSPAGGPPAGRRRLRPQPPARPFSHGAREPDAT